MKEEERGRADVNQPPTKSAKKAGSRIRTDDRLITNQVLYQLSYTGVTGKENLCEDMVSRCTALQMQVSGHDFPHFRKLRTIEADDRLALRAAQQDFRRIAFE